MILVFDLDDTLYDETSYVLSGFSAVAKYVQLKYSLPKDKAYEIMTNELEKTGRGRIFNCLLAKIGKDNAKNVKLLIGVYRKHIPEIKLYEDAEYVLKSFNNFPKYVVTDGNKLVQKMKVEALGVEKYMNKIYITHNYGLDKAKPSTYCFKKIASQENVKNNDIVYIGDNPFKDFINLKKEKYKTIRILRGAYENVKLSKEYEAGNEIKTLYELKKYLKE